MAGAREAIAGNPFYVLALDRTASRAEVERAGQRWLGALALGLADGRNYDTPLGPQPRTEEAVRLATAALRDPDQRLAHEVWLLDGAAAAAAMSGAGAGAGAVPGGGGAAAAETGVVRWEGALRRLGWEAR